MSFKRVLVVGHGSIGKRHLRIARQTLPAANICVLRHQGCPEVPEFADACFSTLEAVCEFAPQIAVIANPSPYHLAIARQLIDIGCHLLIEKPIASNSDDLEDCLALARSNNLLVQVGYNLHFLPSLAYFRQLAQANIVGSPLSIRCEIGQYLPSWRPGSDYRQGVSARVELGGGVLLELSHEIDYLRWIFGEVAWVSAWTGHLSALEINVEDCAYLILGFAQSSVRAAPVARLDMDFIRHDTTRTCLLIGENGSLRWDGVQGVVEQFLPEIGNWQTVFSHKNGRDDSYLAQWSKFLECVAQDRRPDCSGEDGLAVVKIIEAAKRSSAMLGSRIYLSQPDQLPQ